MSISDHPRVSGTASLYALTELAPDVALQIDLNGDIAYANAAVTAVLGYRPSEVIGLPAIELLHDSEHARFGELLVRAASHEPDVERLRFRHANGSTRVLECRFRPSGDRLTHTGVLISTRDLTPQLETEQALRDALAESDGLYNRAGFGYHSLDRDGVIVRINEIELRWLGYTREEVIGRKTFRELLPPLSQMLFDRNFSNFIVRGTAQNLEYELIRKDGSLLPILLSATVITDVEGRYIGSRSVLYDITDRKRTEVSLGRANRALRVLSAANSILIHAEQESELLHAVCRVIIEEGGYLMAWVGYAEHDAARSVRTMAQAGFENGYLDRAGITWSADDERGRGPTGSAIRLGQPQVVKNFLSDPRSAPWREEGRRHGFGSAIALPLKSGDAVIGALSIYAAETHAFDLKEISLLTELVDDLVFGIETLRVWREHRRAQEMVSRLAYFDPLTGLPNRTRLLELLGSALADPGDGLALLTLNVDDFHDIQAGIGVRQADQLLAQVATRLRGALDDTLEPIARISGKAFAVLLRGRQPPIIRHCVQRLRQALIEPFQQAGIPLTVELNIGVALAPDHGEDPEVLLVRSGIAARQRRTGNADYGMYAGTTASESPQRLGLISDLRRAIESDQLLVHYQPKVEIATGRVSGAEALVRWQHPVRGLLPPGEFVPIAEQTGLIKPLTYAILGAVLRQAAVWQVQGFELPVAVNVSAGNFSDPDFVDHVLGLLKTWNVSPRLLQLELTETTLMDEPAKTHDQLVRLQEQGVTVSIDDFGTGYSSLSYVATLPIQSLKIDRSFVVQMLDSPRIHSIVNGTISLARALSITTIAEGVECREQAEELIRMGCDEIQGFYFSPGIPAEALCAWTADFRLADFGLAPSTAVPAQLPARPAASTGSRKPSTR